MRILAFSDISFTRNDELAYEIRHHSPDVIIFAGDGLSSLNLIDFSNIPVLFVAGNNDDELCKEILVDRGAVNLHETPYELERFKCLGMEGMIVNNATVKNRVYTNYCYTDVEAAKHIEQFISKNNPTILVSHTPPYNVLDYSLSGHHCGSRSLRKVSKLPSVILSIFGHAHFSGGNHLKLDNTLYVNVGSYEKAEQNCARLAVIDIEQHDTDITWISVPEEKRSRLFPINDLVNAKSEKEGLAVLGESHNWIQDRHETNEKRISRATSHHSNLALIDEIYKFPYDSKIKMEISWDYDRDESLSDYLTNEFTPWPKHLGPTTMLHLFKEGIELSKIDSLQGLLKELPLRMQPPFRRYIRHKLSERYNKVVVDKTMFGRLCKVPLIFMDSEYGPNTESFLTIGFKDDEEGDLIWIDRVSKKIPTRTMRKHFTGGETFVHYAGNEKKVLGNRKTLDLYREIKNSVYYPLKNRKLQTVFSTFKTLLDKDSTANAEYMMADHQKILLATANYIHPTSNESVPFRLLRNMCETDIEMLYSLYIYLMSLEKSEKCLLFETVKGSDIFYDHTGKEVELQV